MGRGGRWDGNLGTVIDKLLELRLDLYETGAIIGLVVDDAFFTIVHGHFEG